MCLSVPGEVTEVVERHGMPFAKVLFGGVTREVCLAYQPDATVGDFVLVHVGFAIAKIDAIQAAETWAVLEQLGEAIDDEDSPL